MLPFDSYREVLSDHARGHHLIKSAWVIVTVVVIVVMHPEGMRQLLQKLGIRFRIKESCSRSFESGTFRMVSISK